MRALLAIPLIALAFFPLAAGADEEPFVAGAICAWDQKDLRVAIVPPLHDPIYGFDPEVGSLPNGLLVHEQDPKAPWDNTHALAARDAIQTWQRVLQDAGAIRASWDHLAQVTIDVVMLGPEATAEDLADFDVVVLFTEVQDVAGRAVTTCTPTLTGAKLRPDSNTLWLAGSTVLMNQWFVYSFTPEDTYNVLLHEFGHSLGLDHVTAPAEDLMQPVYPHFIGFQGNPQMCVSTLNLAVLAKSFAWIDGAPYASRPSPTVLAADAYALVC